jgi:hypothetical protein
MGRPMSPRPSQHQAAAEVLEQLLRDREKTPPAALKGHRSPGRNHAMPEQSDATAAGVLSLIGQLSERERDRLMRLLEGVPALELAGCVVVPATVLDVMRESYSALAGTVHRLLDVLDRQADKNRGYRLGPALQKSRRQQRERRIDEALANGMTDPEQIRSFILEVDPETVTNSRGVPIRADTMMSNFRRRRRRP